MEYEFLSFEGCTPEEARHLSEILSISIPPGLRLEEEEEEQAPGPPPRPEEEEECLEAPPQPPPTLAPFALHPGYPPNVYINNVTANVNLHHSVPQQQQQHPAAPVPSGEGPPPPHLLATAYPLHHLLLPGYNVSLSLPPPHHPAASGPTTLLPYHHHPHPHHRGGLAVLRNPLMDMQKQFYLQQQQHPPQTNIHPNRYPFNNNNHVYPHSHQQQVLLPQHVQQPQPQEAVAAKPGGIEFGGPPIYQEQAPPIMEQNANNAPSSSGEGMSSVEAQSISTQSTEEEQPLPPPSVEEEEEEKKLEVKEADAVPEEKKAVVEEVVVKETATLPSPPPPPAPAAKSWASLFRSSEGSVESPVEKKPMARISPNNASLEKPAVPSRGVASGVPLVEGLLSSKEGQLGEFLKGYALNHKSFFVKPRGLSNRSNWCFVNAILQALVGCPPFFNLVRALPPLLLESGSVLQSLYEFMAEFSPMEKFPKVHHRRNKKPEDLLTGTTFEASSIYRILLSLPPTDTFKVIEGRQEDAEEFLTFLLNRVNDEMLAVLKKLEDPLPHAEEDSLNNNDEGGDDWKEVGPKNKGCLTRRQVMGNTPLASMVQGQIRSCVTHSSSEPTATLQPFFTLQLDLQSDSIRSVSDALVKSFSMESLDGYVCSKTKVEIAASRSLSIDELPPVLILHLKRFIYNETSGGCQKLLKKVDFPVDLEISKEILSPSAKGKYSARALRAYKLFAVVYHNGTEATKGHYVADVYHTGLSSWIRCDDCTIKSVNEASVLAHTHNSMPYILFYRRGDTLMGPSASADKSKGSSSNP